MVYEAIGLNRYQIFVIGRNLSLYRTKKLYFRGGVLTASQIYKKL